ADRVIERQNKAQWDVWGLGAIDETAWDQHASLTLADLPYGARYVGIEVDDLTTLERLPLSSEVGFYVKASKVSRRVDQTIVHNPLLIVARDADQLDVLLSGADLPAGVEVEIELNQRTAPWLLAHRNRLEQYQAHLRLHQPSYEFLKESAAHDVRDPKAFFEKLALRVKVSGLPGCLTPNMEMAEAPRVLRKNMFEAENGRLAIRELAREHVINGYWGKSVRCRNCKLNSRCDGAHINFLRDQGFGLLSPLREGAWAEDAESQMLQLRPEPPARLRDGRPVEPVAPSLPGFEGPQPAPVEPLMLLGQKVREARERRRLEFQKEASPA
ncbi:MAG TPA: hypothetical protein VMT89_16935, partial [Candidatus Acidoferrales bacterium]|nr:hypothetical protein [Candidatus Acidoferrales bacterium]